jgi:NitT/TauT family transport system substrate-binding protein
LSALVLMGGAAAAKDGQPRVTVAVGGASCLCYLPVVLAAQLGEYERAGVRR